MHAHIHVHKLHSYTTCRRSPNYDWLLFGKYPIMFQGSVTHYTVTNSNLVTSHFLTRSVCSIKLTVSCEDITRSVRGIKSYSMNKRTNIPVYSGHSSLKLEIFVMSIFYMAFYFYMAFRIKFLLLGHHFITDEFSFVQSVGGVCLPTVFHNSLMLYNMFFR